MIDLIEKKNVFFLAKISDTSYVGIGPALRKEIK
jgi:hypothetical protein